MSTVWIQAAALGFPITLFGSHLLAAGMLLIALAAAVYLVIWLAVQLRQRRRAAPPASRPVPGTPVPGSAGPGVPGQPQAVPAKAAAPAAGPAVQGPACPAVPPQMRSPGNEVTLELRRPDGPVQPITPAEPGVGVSTIIGTRSYQQDACWADAGPDCLVGVLCDGMGGMEDGGRASRFCVEQFAGQIGPVLEAEDLCGCMRQIVCGLDAQVAAFTNASGQRLDSGTTLVAAAARRGRLYWVSAGDSRIYLYRAGQLTQLTTDHNYGLQLREQVARGVITPEQAAREPRPDALISYVGMGDIARVDVSDALALQAGDIVMLCSDGICKVFADDAICQLLHMYQELPASEMARCLTEASWKQHCGPMDNTSVVILRL